MLQKRLGGPRRRGSQEAGRDRGGMAQAGARSPSSEDLGPPDSMAGMDPTSPRPDLPSPAAQMSCPWPLGATGVTEVSQLAMVPAVPEPRPALSSQGLYSDPFLGF